MDSGAPHPVCSTQPAASAAPSHWYALWTHSNCEQLVHDQLAAKGLRPFLPTIGTWCRRRGLRHYVTMPMFPSYLFLQHSLEDGAHPGAVRSPGLKRVLGDGWERPAIVPDREMDPILRVHQAGLQVMSHPYLREGARVRITRGVLSGMEGILLRRNFQKGILVLGVSLLQRSVGVEIDCTAVEPA